MMNTDPEFSAKAEGLTDQIKTANETNDFLLSDVERLESQNQDEQQKCKHAISGFEELTAKL